MGVGTLLLPSLLQLDAVHGCLLCVTHRIGTPQAVAHGLCLHRADNHVTCMGRGVTHMLATRWLWLLLLLLLLLALLVMLLCMVRFAVSSCHRRSSLTMAS